MIWRFGIAVVLAAALSLFALNAPHAQFNGCQAGFCSPPARGSTCSPFSYSGTPIYQTLTYADSWTAVGSTLTTNFATSPACTTTAAQIKENSSTSTHTIQKNALPATTALQVVTYTNFAARSVGTRNVQFFIQDLSTFSNGFSALVDLSNCTINTSFANGGFVLVTNTASTVNGFCKYVGTFTANAQAAGFQAVVLELNGSFATSYLGDGASAIAVWGLDWR